MSKKIALCLSGLVGGTKGPDGKGDMVDVDIEIRYDYAQMNKGADRSAPTTGQKGDTSGI